MSREKNTTETVAQAAEFPDGTTLEAGANYDETREPNWIEDKDPAMAYFHAADGAQDDGVRPDGVKQLLHQGYRKSAKKHGAPDCTLLEIPRHVRERRDRERQDRDIALRRAAHQHPRDMPEEAKAVFDGHGNHVRVR